MKVRLTGVERTTVDGVTWKRRAAAEVRRAAGDVDVERAGRAVAGVGRHRRADGLGAALGRGDHELVAVGLTEDRHVHVADADGDALVAARQRGRGGDGEVGVERGRNRDAQLAEVERTDEDRDDRLQARRLVGVRCDVVDRSVEVDRSQCLEPIAVVTVPTSSAAVQLPAVALAWLQRGTPVVKATRPSGRLIANDFSSCEPFGLLICRLRSGLLPLAEFESEPVKVGEKRRVVARAVDRVERRRSGSAGVAPEFGDDRCVDGVRGAGLRVDEQLVGAAVERDRHVREAEVGQVREVGDHLAVAGVLRAEAAGEVARTVDQRAAADDQVTSRQVDDERHLVAVARCRARGLEEEVSGLGARQQRRGQLDRAEVGAARDAGCSAGVDLSGAAGDEAVTDAR